MEKITELQQTLVSRIDQLLNFQPLSETLIRISTTLDEQQQALQVLSEKIEARLQQQIERTEAQLSTQIETVQVSLHQQANQNQTHLESQMDSQEERFQNLMTTQDQHLQKIGHQFLIVNKLPISFSVILFCLLILSTSVNLAVLIRWDIWGSFMIVMIVIILSILAVWGGMFGVSEHSKSGGLIHATESSQSATANHTGQAVTRVAQQAGHSFGANETSTANPNQRYAITVDTNVVDQAYAHYRAGSSKAESANAEQGGDLLERITDYQSTAVENAKIRQGRVSALTNQDKISFEPIRIHTNGRRQRRRKVIHDLADIDNQLTETGEQLGDLTTGYDQQTNRFVSINRRVRKVKNGYDHDAQQFKTATNNLGAVVGTVSAIVNAVIELFKKLFNGLKQQVVGYAKEGVLYRVSGDGKQHQMSQQEAESYMRSHPYDLSGYAQLTLTVKKVGKR